MNYLIVPTYKRFSKEELSLHPLMELLNLNIKIAENFYSVSNQYYIVVLSEQNLIKYACKK